MSPTLLLQPDPFLTLWSLGSQGRERPGHTPFPAQRDPSSGPESSGDVAASPSVTSFPLSQGPLIPSPPTAVSNSLTALRGVEA